MTAPTSRLRSRAEGSLAGLAELRGTTYGVLGSLFLYPAQADLAQLVGAVAGPLGRNRLARGFPFFPRLRILLDLLTISTDGEQLEQEYVALFVVSGSQDPCPPYESAYVDCQGRERGLVSVEVERAYAASGVTLAAHGELPDHAALELGFLSVLCGEEEQAWREDDAERALGWLRREEEFHERHLRRWFSLFARRLARSTAPGSLYHALAEAASAFVVHDRDLVRVLVRERSLVPAPLREPLP